jgi:hypothetical protein
MEGVDQIERKMFKAAQVERSYQGKGRGWDVEFDRLQEDGQEGL